MVDAVLLSFQEVLLQLPEQDALSLLHVLDFSAHALDAGLDLAHSVVFGVVGGHGDFFVDFFDLFIQLLALLGFLLQEAGERNGPIVQMLELFHAL